MLSHAWVDAKLTYQVVLQYILKTPRIYLAFLLFLAILFMLQWLFNIDQLFEIIFGANQLSLVDRIDFMLDGFINIFKFVNDFVPVAMILIAFFQALALTLLISMRSKNFLGAKQAGPFALSLIGVGCVACGGSILGPILGLIASSTAVAIAEGVSRLLLLLALLLSYRSLTLLAFMSASANQNK